MAAAVSGVKTWLPTKKWWTALTTGVSSIVVVWIESGKFDNVEEGMLSALGVALFTSYLKRNDPTPEGVPTK